MIADAMDNVGATRGRKAFFSRWTSNSGASLEVPTEVEGLTKGTAYRMQIAGASS